jgi:hypothetical protein
LKPDGVKEFNTQTLTKQRSVALGTLGVLSATLLGGSMVTPAQASFSTWKKVVIGAGVVTGYGLLKKKKKVALIGGLATDCAYYKCKQDKPIPRLPPPLNRYVTSETRQASTLSSGRLLHCLISCGVNSTSPSTLGRRRVL